LDKAPQVVVSINDTADLEKSKRAGDFDLIELRIDLFSSLEMDHILQVITRCKPYPVIATIRSSAEGGAFKKPEADRLQLFKKVIPHIHAIDIELSSKKILKEVVDAAHKKKKKVIISYHNFDITPPRLSLNRIFKQAHSWGADKVKIATLIRDPFDLQRLARFTLDHADQKIITLGMGEKGTLSRVFFPALGSLLTYAHMGRPTAPGQMSCHQMQRLIKIFYGTSATNQED
jgi:3-dehydroquinate dehydratase-1